MIAELLLATLLDVFQCENIPIEPPVEDAITEGPLGLSGLFEFSYNVVDVDSGRPMILTTQYRIMQMDTATEPVYTLQKHPLFTIIERKGYPDAVWIDQGDGLLGTPRGFCSEMHRR